MPCFSLNGRGLQIVEGFFSILSDWESFGWFLLLRFEWLFYR